MESPFTVAVFAVKASFNGSIPVKSIPDANATDMSMTLASVIFEEVMLLASDEAKLLKRVLGLAPSTFAATISVSGVIFALLAPLSATECKYPPPLGTVIRNRQGSDAVVDVNVNPPSTAVVAVEFPVAHFASTSPLAIAAPVAATPVRDSVFAGLPPLRS